MYHFVWHDKDRFGIHVNIQKVVTFLDIGTYVYDVFTCVPVTYQVSFIPYVDTTIVAAV